jgi:hypothetical protein
VIAKPFATDTLLAEVTRSRKRAADVAAHCDSVTSHIREGDQAVASRSDEAGDGERVPCCLCPLLLARESPGYGDGFSPDCGQVLVRRTGP